MIAPIVLAAGRSERMGSPKPLLLVDGRPLLTHTLDAVRKSALGPPVVVLGHEAERVRREVALDGAMVVVNREYEKGLSTSIRAGIRAADPKAEAFLVVLADQPFVSPSTLTALAKSWTRAGPRILIPTYRGAQGNPVVIDRTLTPEVERLRGDVGCRTLFPNHPHEILEVPVEDPGILFDIDTPEQLRSLAAALDAGRPLMEAVAALVSSEDQGHGHPRTGRPRADVMTLARDLEARGEAFVMATVVRVTRPTSGKPGNRAIVRADRSIVGFVGGSCTDTAVQAESVAALRDGRPRLLHLTKELGVRPVEEGVVEYFMECHSGGTMDIYIEPHVPKARLLVVGDSPVAETLVALGRLMDYHVVLVAPRATPETFPEADEVQDHLERLPDLVTRDTCAVVATMGKYDSTALRALAPSALAYLGLVASRKRAEAVKEELRKAGLAPVALERIHSPAGIDLAAQTPQEIALSIMAEITKERRSETSREIPMMEHVPSAREAKAILDVVCGMEVDPATPLKVDHAGATYYFCSEGCREQFLESPNRFVHQG